MNLEASGRVETLCQNDLQLSDVSLLVQLPQTKMWVCSLHVAFFNSLLFLGKKKKKKKLMCHATFLIEKLRNTGSRLARWNTSD